MSNYLIWWHENIWSRNEDQRHPFGEQIAQWSSRMLANAPGIKAIFWRWKTIKLYRDCKYLISFGIWAAQTLLPYTPPGAPRLLTEVTPIAQRKFCAKFCQAPGSAKVVEQPETSIARQLRYTLIIFYRVIYCNKRGSGSLWVPARWSPQGIALRSIYCNAKPAPKQQRLPIM